ncbi:DUF2752 domain-containing protein [Paenibacillus sp. NPDC058071]|uniref:DUF2752 domain-containing protein n=1 Tax=Paenibacillus sp. NPDC058071 TaxID=3346326 RepID=UPI0036DC0400
MLTTWLMLKRYAKQNPKLVWGSVLGIGGLIYIKAWLPLTGIGIPCPFHAVTGLFCPGCGITRTATSLLKLDFEQAYRNNALIFFLVPLYLAYLFSRRKKWTLPSNALMTVMVAATLLFGVLRNVPAISWLAPESG